MYPVGSVYMNYKNNTNPKTLLGCGTWSAVNANYYLMAASTSKNNSDYNAYNNSYGNYAGSYLNECLPNITGTVEISTSADANTQFADAGSNLVSQSGALKAKYRRSNTIENRDNYGNWWSGIDFDASSSNPIYRQSCNMVRPKSYVVYMWVRTS